MPNTREKLIELIQTAKSKKQYDFLFGNIDDAIDMKSDDEYIADHLIANGVTVQKWIPLTEQKPDRDELVIVFFEGMRDTNCAIQIMYGWCLGGSASHWMPLPEPPKGE